MTNNHDELRQRLRSSLDRGPAPDLSSDLVRDAAGHQAPRLTNPARTFRIAGVAGVAIAAVTVGALVVGPSMTRAPLFTASASSGNSALGTSEAMSSYPKMMMWVDYRYTAGSSLSTAGASGPVYQLVLDTTDPQARAADLADVLGVEGAVTKAEYYETEYPTWVVGPQDGTGMDLTLSAFGTGDWWFNDPTASSVYVCDPSVTTVDADAYGCILPADAPANMAPTGEKARALAQALFASTGYDVAAADIQIDSNADGTSASAYLTVDGIKTGLNWNAYWSNTGELSYAYGHSVRLESRGTFDTVSPTDAVKRLDDYRWYGSPGPDFQGGMMMYARGAELEGAPVSEGDPGEMFEPGTEPSAPPVVEPSAPDESPEDPIDALADEPVEPAVPSDEETLPPVDVEPTPEVVDVTVDNATATLLLMWDAEGNAWLVPGYATQMPDGWWSSVVSLVDGVIALPELM